VKTGKSILFTGFLRFQERYYEVTSTTATNKVPQVRMINLFRINNNEGFLEEIRAEDKNFEFLMRLKFNKRYEHIFTHRIQRYQELNLGN
jgi:hypothetical protein